MHEIMATVSGRVQGVAYRAYAQDAATALSLQGWVVNQLDGTVAVCAQGDRDTLKDFIEYLHEGSLHAHVETVSVEWGTAGEMFDDFSIRY